MGHDGPVTCVRFNPRMFRLPEAEGSGGGADAESGRPGGDGQPQQANGHAAQANGAGAGALAQQQAGPGHQRLEDRASLLIALGSSDRRFTVWAHSRPQVLVVGSNLFRRGIVLDVAWSHDGRNLVVCSSDGTIATCRWA